MHETDLRHELKIVVESHLLAQARSWIRLHPAGFRTTFAPRLVNNLYLDTPHLNSFNANLAGNSTRQKLRLRWYGPITLLAEQPTLELKCKSDLLGNKKLQELDCVLDWQRPYRHILQTIRHSAGAKWAPWLNAASQPTIINQYQREYFANADGSLRATLDYGQIVYDQQLAARPNLQRRLPLENFVVIEVKAPPAYSEALQEAMAYFPAPRSRNSKYVNGVAASWL
jgi:hypothetical protein